MGVIRKKNPVTGEWEVYGSTDAKDINLIDLLDNFDEKNVEGALREVSTKLNETLATIDEQKNAIMEHANTLIEHASDIEWLKQYGGGGSGVGGGGVAPTITSTFESCDVDKETEIVIPIFFSSPNLGEGTAYVIINNIEVASIPGIKQGNNKIEIGKLTEQKNEISIYVKDRVNMLSNQLTWNVNIGGIDLEVDFDDTADYFVSELVTMQYYLSTTSSSPMTMHIKIDYDEFEYPCKNGYNEFEFPQLGVGVHSVEFYVTDGTYLTQVKKFNVVIVNSTALYVSSTFTGGEFVIGVPVQIQYRISKASTEYFDVKLYLNDKLDKQLSCNPGTYYWTLSDLDIGEYNIRIEVSGAYDEPKILEFSFNMISSGYEPLKITEQGLVYRLNAKRRTNQDLDKANPIDDSGKGVVTTLHNFNWHSNGWIDGELVCDGEAYAEIDFYPYMDNALYGSTIEICYTALDIGKNDARVLDYTGIEEPFKGLYVDIEEASLKSLTNTGMVYTDKDIEMTLTFVIDRKNKFGKIFINGICSRAFSLSDSGSGTSATREDFTHQQKIYLNSKKGVSNFGACKIKDVRMYNRVLSDDEIVTNYIAQISDLKEQERMYNFNFNNTTLPVIRMYGDMTNMTLETPVTMRIKYTSPNEDKYGQSFDLPYCQVNWQGTSSLQYVLKNFTARLKDENMAPYDYSPYVNGVKEDTYCFKCDYMESTHSRNVGIAKFVNDCLYDAKNPAQQKDPNIRNSINGFPALMYINDELQGVYNFNLDRYSTKSFGYTDPDKVLVYEISANSDTTAGAFYSWTESSGKAEDAYYQSDFECLYPPTRAAGNDSLTELKRLIEWVDKSSDEDFKDNISRYFNLEYLLRYYLFVLVFGAVDSLGKNAKIASFDGGLTWHFQVYDADTTCGLNNSGFLLFGTDIEMGDQNVFNTTGSRLWQRVVFLFQDQLKEQYSLMRQGRFTVDNIMKYMYGEQISQIPATFYNKDMQSKYLNFGSAYLYALHGSGETHIKRWIRERLMYVDTLLGYMVSSSDYITLRANKLGYVYLDIQMYIPMYVTVKWRDEAGGTGIQTKRVGRGETVRFEYSMPTETDQEVLVYAGHYIKSLGDVSNLQPSTMLIANANRLTEITCHSTHLINTDLSECKLLQKIDISGCTSLGTGIGAQPILNIEQAKYLRYLDCRDTQLTAIYTMQSGSNLEEIYYPKSIQEVNLINQAYLRVVGIPYEVNEETGVVTRCESLADVTIDTCKNVEYMRYPYTEGDYVNLDAIKHVQNLTLIDSLDKLERMRFEGFNKLKNLTLSTMHNITSLGFDDMLTYRDTASLESIKVSDCPLIDKVTFNMSNVQYKVEFVENAVIDLGGMQSVKSIESNASIKGLRTLIIPTSLKDLRFTAELGDGTTSIVNVWSAAANHANDGFEGMDLLDVSLEYLDMAKLINVDKAINFNIAPTTQHPNMNTVRTDKFFIPEGVIDLSNYTGDMANMLKGVDLSKLEVIVSKNQYQMDLTGLFENAILNADSVDKINEILSKYPNSNNWSKLFKNANIKFSSLDINIPDESSRRNMNLSEMFYNTSVSDDIIMTGNLVNVSNMFRNCKNMKVYQENWNKTLNPNIITDDCYKGTGGDLDFVPTIWGGYGFFPDVTTIAIINVPTSDYTVKISARGRVTTTYGVINWGDGTIDNLYENDYSHTFAYPGLYTIKGHYAFGLGSINHSSVNSTLTEVIQMATNVTNLSSAFKYCNRLETVNVSAINATNLKDAFAECNNLINIDLSKLNTENVANMNSMFLNCKKLKQLDLSNFVTDKVNNMGSMFNGCVELTELDLNNFNTELVTNMNSMFNGCEKLTSLNVSSFDTSNVTDMGSMFYNCRALPMLEITNFNTEQVENMGYMFNRCSKLENIDVSNIDTSVVNNMKYMFAFCENLSSLNIGHFITDNVGSIEGMFCGCSDLGEIDLSNFNTSKVESMSSLFENCLSLKSVNLLNWDTSKTKTMDGMFEGCKQLNELSIEHFDTSEVINMETMFKGCSSLLTLNLSNFNTDKVNTMESMFEGCTNLSSLDLSNFVTGNVSTMRQMFYNCNNLTTLNVSSFNTENVTNMYNMFYNCKKVTELNVSNFNTEKVTDMGGMFYGCNNLPSIDVSGFVTDKVTNMEYLFYGCVGVYSLPISNWNVGNVRNMANLFYSCVKLNKLDLSSWNTSNVTDMYNIFHTCSALTELKMDGWNTENVTNMAYMFHNCEKLSEINISNFNTKNVTNMRNMFYGCKALTGLDLSHLDTSKVNNMSYMLCNLYGNVKFNNKPNNALKNVTAMFNMFYGDSIDMSNFSLANSTNNTQFIAIAPNLVNFIPPINIKTSIKLTADKLSIESLRLVIDNLEVVTKPQNIEIGATNIGKLSDEEIATIVNKGWSVS